MEPESRCRWESRQLVVTVFFRNQPPITATTLPRLARIQPSSVRALRLRSRFRGQGQFLGRAMRW